MIHTINPEVPGELDQGRVVLGRNGTVADPHTDVARLAADSSRDGAGAAESKDERARGFRHEALIVPSGLTPGKRVVNMVDALPEHKTPAAIGYRLRLLRYALEMGATRTVAEQLGLERTRWANWESGVAAPPAIHMMALHELYPDVCLNYLYLGDPRNCPRWLRKRFKYLEGFKTLPIRRPVINWPADCQRP